MREMCVATETRTTADSPLVAPGHTTATVTDKIAAVVLQSTPRWFYPAFGASFGLLMLFMYAVTILFAKGVGIWGVNNPAGWGFAIVNFVWWIGIGHAGTLISAILLLLRQKWRQSINRFAEAMTLFAVACAGIYPILHLGRPWLAYWLFPYPATTGVWPQFRSPLIWDVFAISTYALVSLMFWYVGLIPDLATLRDRTQNRIARVVYGMMAMGWRGSAKHWHHHDTACILLAALATPLVVSVHSVVSFDFAAGIIPGWHTTLFPPYFVAGAIFAGFAMVITLCIPLRAAFGLHDFITEWHVRNMAKVMLATGLIVNYGYGIELFIAWYSGNIYEKFAFYNRAFGPFWWAYFSMVFCNVVVPQAFWIRKVRLNPWAVIVLCLLINVGMWFERFVIIATSLTRTFLPASWTYYTPTFYDVGTFIGTLGLFMTLFLLFCRYLPIVAISEVKNTLPEAHAGKDH